MERDIGCADTAPVTVLQMQTSFMRGKNLRPSKTEARIWLRVHRAGVPKRSRTSGLLLRRQSLYPTELLGHLFNFTTILSQLQQKQIYFSNLTNIFAIVTHCSFHAKRLFHAHNLPAHSAFQVSSAVPSATCDLSV